MPPAGGLERTGKATFGRLAVSWDVGPHVTIPMMERMMQEIPEIQYAKSGELNLAYQCFGETVRFQRPGRSSHGRNRDQE
jgi:hypothetical protein